MVLLFASLWHARVTGGLSFAALAAFALVCGGSMAWGRLFTQFAPLAFAHGRSLTLQFLCGFLVLNSLLFALSLASPLGIAVNLLVLTASGILLLHYARGKAAATPQEAAMLPDLLCILISGAAATLWCADAFTPAMTDGEVALFRTWQDRFIHARFIGMFSQSHGLGTMTDIQLAGTPLRLYHYAFYFVPAAIQSMTEAGAYDVFVGFLLPFGVVLTGLAAFSLVASIWGSWPALAAAVAVVLLPDAYQQGFGNRYLAYHFHQQVGPSGMYGVACAAVAWIFILDGCRTGRYAPVLAGYAATVLSLAYKAQIFAANAFLAMIYPCLFFFRLPAARRLLAAIGLLAVFLLVLALSQGRAGVPTLRLDGSSAETYLSILLNDFEHGVLRDFSNFVFAGEVYPGPVLAALAAGVILLSTFGFWTAACLVTLYRLRKRAPAAVLLFPILVVANYLVMSVGLAMDVQGVGTRDELMNRPLVWAYFVVAAWTGGAAYLLAFGNAPPGGSRARALAAAFACLCLAFPLALSGNLQTFPARKGFGSFTEFGAVPSCLVRAALHIREHSPAGDIVQDSQNDSNLLVSALAERQAYAVRFMFPAPQSGELNRRLAALEAFGRITDAAGIAEFARRHRISWYLLHPGSAVAWPGQVLDNPAFRCDGYRVYRFETSPGVR